ncbi:hypothetical protein OPV22_008131 [Ensete ventricosum]|uniref:DUF1618 domain-containing protein n=1 Tax=Ensete ventricosum TaxID=4639 RepID=A0AAV8RE11_ENSVE|nr:hypothetical protein OPV22_008131 [Ensete ventricosum]RWW30820.1 hypothetical protein GW17_00004584 [Ensete ventricosum]
MAKVLPFLALLALVYALPAASGGGGVIVGSGRSFRDLLRNYGLPAGLIPRAIESFDLDPSSGLLEVRLHRTCYARYDAGLAYFDRVVRGNLSYGALSGVVGWSQEELFLWFPVKGLLIADPSSGVILFDIGLAQKHLSVSAFEDPPDCQPAALAIFGEDEEPRGDWISVDSS